MKVSLIGYGKMGKEIEKVCLSRKHEILARIDNTKDWEDSFEKFKSSDMAFEFSLPGKAAENLYKCFSVNIPVVCGTTAWDDQLEEIAKYVTEKNKTLLFAPNFNVGVNIFRELNRKLAAMMNNFREYTVGIEEIHHTQKLDAPSGTAISLANDIIEHMEHKEKWVKKIAHTDGEFEIKSIRKNNIPGTHIIRYDSDLDTIELKHTAKNREGFALGAVMAGEWLQGKKGFYSLYDVLGF